MRFKSGLLVGFGAGYVLGAKAGRERYQQIIEAARAFMENPGVQRLTDEVGKTVNLGKDRVSAATSRTVEQVGSTLADQASKAKDLVGGAKAGAGKAGAGKPGEEPAKTAAPSAKTAAPSAKTAAGEQAGAEATPSGAPPATATRSGRPSS
jgi:hypothetical protein